jgi:hypothetical protein
MECDRTAAIVWRVHLPAMSNAEQIMVMPAQRTPHKRWTEEEFYRARDAAPPGERWELVDGDVLAELALPKDDGLFRPE